MKLAYRQLTKQIFQNKIFAALLLLLTILTSASFFFCLISIDGNMKKLLQLSSFTKNQQLYLNALRSNTFLGYNFLLYTSAMTAFVLVMFYYRFFRTHKKQMGCLKSLGFRDSQLSACFVLFTLVLQLCGGILGLGAGYLLSDILLDANMRTYSVTGLVKGISQTSLLAGLGGPTLLLGLTAYLCYFFIKGKEPGVLMAGNHHRERFSLLLRAADAISARLPVKEKFPYRIALRKPLSLLLIVIAVMCFNVFLIMGRSVNTSSDLVFESQTRGHNYNFDTTYDDYLEDPAAPAATGAAAPIYYLKDTVLLTADGREISRQVFGLHSLNEVYELQNQEGESLPLPDAGTVYIDPGLADTCGVKRGDILEILIGKKQCRLTVSQIAVNAQSASLYMNSGELAAALEINPASYNGVLSSAAAAGGTTVTQARRIAELNRNAVSNQVSGVLNQLSGVLIGILLLFLALYVNFQDNTRDMMILHLLGYRNGAIRKMLVDVYLPIMNAAFLLTLFPSIRLARAIQRSLSVSTGDYMPFETNLIVALIIFAALNLIYQLVQMLFGLGIKHIIQKEEISGFIYAE